ncbi:13979_t:CDS:2 [Cetraspora pellucida]|uniref:13979_t:CDS:1 n=1 Tax=Cetraspora pellucida TaxID=1433469 RepID=A0A9N9DV64_9GLOM|nr:13979_t:CDS:2 [Cetraspora pellucida]
MPTNFQVIENQDEIMLLGMDWFQKVHTHLHFNEKNCFLDTWDNGNFFDKYKDEKMEEVESYHTDEAMIDKEDLFTNLWRNEYSSTIYLTIIKEFLTTKGPDKPEPTPEETIQALVQTNILNRKQKEEALLILKCHSKLFSTGLDKLGYKAEVQHKINIENAK